MKARTILIIHTTIFLCFAFAAISSPYFALHYPEYFSALNLIVFGVIAVAVVGTWPLFGGCPFTIWENTAWKRENPSRAYRGACIDHYIERWFGIRLPDHLSTIALIVLFLIPIVSGLVW